MWPFSNPNVPVISEKRAQRSRALAGIPTDDASQKYSEYLQATGKFSIFVSRLLLKLNGSISAPEIVTRIQQGEWTATQVLEAYIARAAYAHAKTNCLTESRYSLRRVSLPQSDDP